MTIYKDIDFSKGLTEEQLAMLREVEASPAVPDEDCPEVTEEQLAKFAVAARERRQKLQNKQTVAIRLSPQALQKAKSLGKGYTAVLSRILEAALADNETIKHYL
ncbi:MAG: BrnA antitoxin family protein [Prevotella sp.]|nr:BrnA antitoxin family protein [Prevotella sp.]